MRAAHVEIGGVLAFGRVARSGPLGFVNAVAIDRPHRAAVLAVLLAFDMAAEVKVDIIRFHHFHARQQWRQILGLHGVDQFGTDQYQ